MKYEVLWQEGHQRVIRDAVGLWLQRLSPRSRTWRDVRAVPDDWASPVLRVCTSDKVGPGKTAAGMEGS